MTLYWALFAVSIVAFVVDFIAAGRLAGLGVALHIIGLVPCGFGWLLARALFRSADDQARWPDVIVAVLFASCLVLYLDPGDQRSGLVGYIGHIQTLLGSAMLVLTFVEAIDTRETDARERRFRRRFMAGYLLILAAAFLFDLPELAAWQHAAQASLASVALVGATLAWRHRLTQRRERTVVHRREAPSYPHIAAGLTRLMEQDHAYLDAGLKVADVAARLGEPDYKVSQSIVNDLGYANFNRLINGYRLRAAERLLTDPERARDSILAIALDCGFGSLGPFNRSFKAHFGVTPSAYRTARRADDG